MKIKLLDLEFSTEHFYLQTSTIVEKVTFNNRTFYSKYKKVETPLNSTLLRQHQNREVTLAVPLVENDFVNYIVIEYHQEDWNRFYALLKYLFKSLEIEEYQSYYHHNLLQVFIPQSQTPLEIAYKLVENIHSYLELKSNKSYKIYPNKFLPKNHNIITLPTQKL